MVKRLLAIIMVFVLVFSGILYVCRRCNACFSEKPQDIAIRARCLQFNLRWTNGA